MSTESNTSWRSRRSRTPRARIPKTASCELQSARTASSPARSCPVSVRGWSPNSPAIAQLSGGHESLDVQGLAWDPSRRLFLLGIRSATANRRPLVLAIRIKDWAGPWTVANLEALEAISLGVPDSGKPKGIYSLVRHPSRPIVYAVVRDSDGRSGAAELYEWDGNEAGTVKLVPDIVFHPGMRPEGLAFGTIGNRAALVIVDDNGGYSVLWVDELPFLAG